MSDSISIPEDTHLTVQIGRTIVTTKAKSKSKVPEFTTNGSHINMKNKFMTQDPENADDGYKLEGNTKIIEIDGKRFLVMPEEGIDGANQCKFPKYIPLPSFG